MFLKRYNWCLLCKLCKTRCQLFFNSLQIFEIEKNEDSSYEEVDSLDMTNRCVNIYVYTVYTYIHIMTIEVCDMCMIMTNGCCCKHLWCYGVIVKSFPNPFININRSVAQRHHRFQLQIRCDWGGLPYDSARWLPSPYLTPEVGIQRVTSVFVFIIVFL